jgi:hypothetical protein
VNSFFRELWVCEPLFHVHFHFVGDASGAEKLPKFVSRKGSQISDDGSTRSLSDQVTEIDHMLSEFLKTVLCLGASAQKTVDQLNEEREELVAASEARDKELASLRCAVGNGARVVNGTASPVSPLQFSFDSQGGRETKFLVPV